MDIKWDLIAAGIINFFVLLILFRKLLGDKIVQQIEKRKELLNKLKKADDEYKKMIEFARKESGLLIEKAEKKKKEIVHESHLIAEKEKAKIIKSAEDKVRILLDDAKIRSERMEKDLKEGRVSSVKDTSKKVVKRLLKQDKELADQYFNVLVDDLAD